MEEKAQAFQRRWRLWIVCYAILIAIPYLLDLAGPSAGARKSPADWSMSVLVMFCWTLVTPTARTTPLPDEGLHFERSEAIRLGYMVIVVLGAIAAICANYWPAFISRCWPLIIIVGVLVPQVRLIVLDQRVVIEAGDDTQ